MLFINGHAFGFQNYEEQLKAYSAARDDIDAVHIDLARPLWQKIMGKRVTALGDFDFHPHRYLWLWRQIIASWLRGPLSLEHFDVVHFMNVETAGAMLDVPRPPHVAFAVNIDATPLQRAREFGKSRLPTSAMHRLAQPIFDAADLVICRNRWAARSARIDLGLPAHRVHLATSAIKTSSASRCDRPWPSAALPNILFVGNDFRRKGGPELVRLHQQHYADRAVLHVVSGGCRPMPNTRNVVWHGAVQRRVILEELLPEMDLFVLWTRQDMFPWAILEAAAAGLPVVASRLASIPELVVEGVTGALCDPRDPAELRSAIDGLLAEPRRRRMMGRAARAMIAAYYNPDTIYNGLLDRLISLSASQPSARTPPLNGAAPTAMPLRRTGTDSG